METMAELRKAFGRLIESYRHPADDGLVPMYTAPRNPPRRAPDRAPRAGAGPPRPRGASRHIARAARGQDQRRRDGACAAARCGATWPSATALPDKPLIAGMPVALSRVPIPMPAATPSSPAQVSLATHVADPLQRLATVHGSSAARQGADPRVAVSVTALTVYMDGRPGCPTSSRRSPARPSACWCTTWCCPTCTACASRRYVNGARIEAEYPMSLLVPGQAMNITVISHADEAATSPCSSARAWCSQPQRVADAIARRARRAGARLPRPARPRRCGQVCQGGGRPRGKTLTGGAASGKTQARCAHVARAFTAALRTARQAQARVAANAAMPLRYACSTCATRASRSKAAIA
jgi:hypothetical protein